MFLNEDVIYFVLLWLPVISLLRFKLVCKSWRTTIESKRFVREHLHHHHQNLKYENRQLLARIPGDYPPITFPFTSIDSLEEPNKCMQLDSSDLHGSFPVKVYDIVCHDGIVCLNLYDRSYKQCICIWNPATKESRFLPQSPSRNIGHKLTLRDATVGFGFDDKEGDYKVVNIVGDNWWDERRVDIYSFCKDSWRSLTAATLPDYVQIVSTVMPFNNGTSFCWKREYAEERGVICFDFVSETFRSLSFPDVQHRPVRHFLGVTKEKITCVFNADGDIASEIEVWMFTEYGSVNETWVKFCRIDPYSAIPTSLSVVLLSMNGEYIFFHRWDVFVRYNIITEEIKILSWFPFKAEILNGFPLPHPNMYFHFNVAILDFKESLLSVGP